MARFRPAPTKALAALLILLMSGLALGLAGCGYAPIRGDGAPMDLLDVGVITDGSPEGHLGLVVGEAARVAIGGRARPQLGPGGPELRGEVTVGTEAPLGFDGSARTATYTAPVTVQIWVQGEGGLPRWRGLPVSRTAQWLRATTPLETREARRLAVERAAQEAVAVALDDLWQSPSLGPDLATPAVPIDSEPYDINEESP
jgi:hypothetical protein